MVAPSSDGPVTAREFFAELNALRNEMRAGLENVLTRLSTDFTLHRTEHEREKDRRGAFGRWAISSILTVGGVLLTIGGMIAGILVK